MSEKQHPGLGFIEKDCKGELIAETGAACLCAVAGIASENNRTHPAACLQNCIKQFQNDNRLFLLAAPAAQKAVNMITGQNLAEQEEQPA